jgi:hypothetical protein
MFKNDEFEYKINPTPFLLGKDAGLSLGRKASSFRRCGSNFLQGNCRTLENREEKALDA